MQDRLEKLKEIATAGQEQYEGDVLGSTQGPGTDEQPPHTALEAAPTAVPPSVPEDGQYPQFAKGDRFVMKGWPFRVVRVNISSLVLKPELPEDEHSARRLMRKMT